MNGRDRILRKLAGKSTDRAPWVTIADDLTRSTMPKEIRELGLLDFYRTIGCDILQFGNYGLPEGIGAKYPYRRIVPAEVHESVDGDGLVTRRLRSDWGELVSTFRKGHPIRYPVQNVEDLKLLQRIWRDSSYVLDEEGAAASFRDVEAAIGGDGIFVPTLDPSPVQSLMEFDMGTESFCYLLEDHPREMEDLIETMHAVRMQEYRIVASAMPFDVVIPVENTSSFYISPSIYRRFSMRHMRDFVDTMHAQGKLAVLHMCGHLYHLLDEIRETGLDGIHALTPPRLGDVDYEHALDRLGNDLIIIGCLDASIFQNPAAGRTEIEALLRRIYTPRLRKSRFILWPAADGIPTDLERFLWVRDWIRDNG
jgi:hypothetical protein